MSVEYSIPWIRHHLHLSDKLNTNRPGEDSAGKQGANSTENDKHSKTFLLFIRLPSWKPKSEVFEVCTLRNLRNYVEIFKVKQLLELAVGLPAHVAEIYTCDDKKIPDSTQLILGSNIANGNTVHLRLQPAWDDLAKAIWTKSRLGDQLPAWQQHGGCTKAEKNAAEENWSEKTGVGLFIAASRGNLPACKALLMHGANPNYTTVFGNACIHGAAYKGHIDILQLLVPHGADIRCKNVRNKSAMDIAIAQGFVDCAKWLWLNQWSISITRDSGDPPLLAPASDVRDKRPKSARLKPPDKSSEPEDRSKHVEFEKSRHVYFRRNNTAANWSSEYTVPHRLRMNSHPGVSQSSPQSAHQRRRSTLRVSFPKTRPQTSPAGDPLAQASMPKLMAEVTSSLKREKSIPSKYECRYSSYDDVAVNGRLNKLFRTTTPHSGANDQLPSSEPAPEKNSLPTYDINKSRITSDDERTYVNLHADSSVRNEAAKSKHEITTVEPLHKKSVPITTAWNKTKVLDPPTGWKDMPKRTTFDIVQREHPFHTKDPEIKTSNQNTFPEHRPDKRLHEEENIGKTSSNNDRLTSLPEVERSNAMTSVPENRTETSITRSGKVLPRKLKVIKQESTTKMKEEEAAVKERKERLKRERSEKAYEEWLIAKQRERIESKKAEMLNSLDSSLKRRHGSFPGSFPGQTWGISFEEWLDKKKSSLDTRPSTSKKDSTQKKTHVSTSGKSFEEWLKDKSSEKPRQEKSDEKDEEEERKLQEMRQRKFDLWVARKTELARKERRAMEILEQKKLHEMHQDYEEWVSQPRVMTFDEWRKRKENEIKFGDLCRAQEDIVMAIGEWMVRDREQLAEQAFNRWALRKESEHLQEAQHEWKSAKATRKKVEHKVKQRLAAVRARAKLRRKNAGLSEDDVTESDSNSALSPEVTPRSENVFKESSSSSSSDEDDNAEHTQLLVILPQATFNDQLPNPKTDDPATEVTVKPHQLRNPKTDEPAAGETVRPDQLRNPRTDEPAVKVTVKPGEFRNPKPDEPAAEETAKPDQLRNPKTDETAGKVTVKPDQHRNPKTGEPAAEEKVKPDQLRNPKTDELATEETVKPDQLRNPKTDEPAAEESVTPHQLQNPKTDEPAAEKTVKPDQLLTPKTDEPALEMTVNPEQNRKAASKKRRRRRRKAKSSSTPDLKLRK